MKKPIYTDEAPVPVGPYSQAVLSTYGHLLFISGQIPIDKTGKVVGKNIKEQTNQVMKNIESILKSQGLNFDNILRCDVYLTDLKNFNEFNEEYKKFFKNGYYPARVTIEVCNLPKGALVEISAIAGM